MKNSRNNDSMVSAPLLGHLRVKYSISMEFNFQALDLMNILLISHQGLFTCLMMPRGWTSSFHLHNDSVLPIVAKDISFSYCAQLIELT